MKKLQITLLALSLLVGCRQVSVTQEKNQQTETQNLEVVQNLDALQFKNHIETQNGTVLDVRTSAEFSAEHIPNAVNFDVNSSDFYQQINSLEKNKPIYVYCRSGRRSLLAANILQQNGFTKIFNLKNGFLSWKSMNYPIK